MKRLKLSGQYGVGKFALVDDEDYDFIIACGAWYGTANGYVAHTFKHEGVALPEYLHRVLMQPPPEAEVDHINLNKLDNRRSNLRICTQRQNNYNLRIRKDNTTGYKGVYWSSRINKWVAQIMSDTGKRLHLGCFEDKEEASHIYNQFAAQLFGEFARLNKI